jgi:hypothetical protein
MNIFYGLFMEEIKFLLVSLKSLANFENPPFPVTLFRKLVPAFRQPLVTLKSCSESCL